MTFAIKAADQSTKPLKARIYLQDPFVAAQEPSVGIEEIDTLNIYHAGLVALRRAVEALAQQAEEFRPALVAVGDRTA